MLFNLELKQKNGTPRHLLFDNTTNHFTDPETGHLFFTKQHVQDWLRYTPVLSFKKDEIGMMFIQLGMKCNYECKYCHQNNIRSTTEVEDATPSKAARFLEMLEEAKLNPKYISFWGGEPLVYWKAMKVLIPGLKRLYPKARINFPTNGSLLTQEIIQYLDDNEIEYFVSYDGKVSNRGESILDSQKVVEGLKATREGVAIMPTFNRASIPIKELKKEFDDKRIRLKHIAIYAVARCNPYNRSIANEILIPAEKKAELSSFLYDVLTHEKENHDIFNGVFGRFKHKVRLMQTGMGIDAAAITYCGNATGHDICVDLAGKIFNCMNVPVKVIGTLNRMEPFNATEIFQNHLFKDKCFDCPYITMCFGGCPLIHDENSPEFKVSCSNLKLIAVPFFRAAIERLFDAKLLTIRKADDGTLLGEF